MARSKTNGSARTAPIIVLGMGRSGTTLVVEALERLGVFMGVRQDVNREAISFQGANRSMLASLGVSLDQPEALPDLEEKKQLRDELANIAMARLRGPRLVTYLGWPRYLRSRSLRRLHDPWGWKDPRNTLTFPVWREIFPDARVIHVVRHGVDVAASYRRVHPQGDAPPVRAGLARTGMFARPGYWRGRGIRFPARRRSWEQEVTRLASLQAGIEVWSRYADRAGDLVASLGGRGLDVRFEDLLADPGPTAQRLAEFCSVPPEDISDLVQGDRAYAFRRDPELITVAREHEARLRGLGYGPEGAAATSPRTRHKASGT